MKDNLFHGTIAALYENNKLASDVLWVGSRDGEYAISWEQYQKLADVDYEAANAAYSSRFYVATDLIIVGADWWLERPSFSGDVYDIRWLFRSAPAKKASSPFTVITGHLSQLTLDRLNNPRLKSKWIG